MSDAPAPNAGEIRSIDARGLKCPMPVLKARKALARAAAGERIEVLCTDPVSVIDIPNLAREMGARIETAGPDGSAYRFILVAGDSKS